MYLTIEPRRALHRMAFLFPSTGKETFWLLKAEDYDLGAKKNKSKLFFFF
jgi:hypothetical protein